MIFSRTRLFLAATWAMIPVAVLAGWPSTACVCANGQVKLVCSRVMHACRAAEMRRCVLNSGCCEEHHSLASRGDDTDCCGGCGPCGGKDSEIAGVASKACCKPLLSPPGVVPDIISMPSDEAPVLAAVLEQVGAPTRLGFSQDAAQVNTGPPFDRVIVFRSLLI